MAEIDFKSLKEALDSKYGAGNWKIRKVSRIRRHSDIPSLTISEELEKIGCKPDDFVVVVLSEGKIVVYRA